MLFEAIHSRDLQIMHPIYQFVRSNDTALQRLVRPPASRVPTVAALERSLVYFPMDISKPQSGTTVSSPLLAPFELVPKASEVNSAPTSNFTCAIGSPKSLSPMKPSSKRKTEGSTSRTSQKFTRLSRQFSPLSPDVIDLSLLPSSPLVMDTKAHISLSGPSPSTPLRILKSEPNLIDLCTPDSAKLRMPSFVPLQLSLHSHTMGNIKSEAIDLCSPDRKPIVRSKPVFVLPQPHSHLKAEATIDPVRSPDRKPAVRSVDTAPGLVHVGDVFNSWEAAQNAVYAREARIGFQWRIGQGKLDSGGHRKKVTFRCRQYYHTSATHGVHLDPSDFRQGKSIRTGCEARVNINRVQNTTNLWRVTFTQWKHNHPRAIPEGGSIQRPATADEKKTITQLATNSSQKFSRGQISAILETQGASGSRLEPRQIGNIINTARKQARDEVTSLGGDIPAILASLTQKSSVEHGWRYHLKLDESSVVTGIWWQSPLQGELGRRYGDVLINDNTYNRNRSGYPLNIGIIIDLQGASRNIWYALHGIEDIEHHIWVLECHLDSAGHPPATFMSDHDRALIAAVMRSLPLTDHLYCIHHLTGNVEINLRKVIGGEWPLFSTQFWAAYRAVSPDEFDRLWTILTANFPAAEKYLNDELYTCRAKWAWAWTSFKFTCGVRTNGRVESENRVNKTIGGPKKSLKQLFDGLNERTKGQATQELIRVRDV